MKKIFLRWVLPVQDIWWNVFNPAKSSMLTSQMWEISRYAALPERKKRSNWNNKDILKAMKMPTSSNSYLSPLAISTVNEGLMKFLSQSSQISIEPNHVRSTCSCCYTGGHGKVTTRIIDLTQVNLLRLKHLLFSRCFRSTRSCFLFIYLIYILRLPF